jgi:hypothetical protein
MSVFMNIAKTKAEKCFVRSISTWVFELYTVLDTLYVLPRFPMIETTPRAGGSLQP